MAKTCWLPVFVLEIGPRKSMAIYSRGPSVGNRHKDFSGDGTFFLNFQHLTINPLLLDIHGRPYEENNTLGAKYRTYVERQFFPQLVRSRAVLCPWVEMLVV